MRAAHSADEDPLWVPRQKERVTRRDHVAVTPLFDDRPISLGVHRDDERPRISARVIDMRTWRAAEGEVRPDR